MAEQPFDPNIRTVTQGAPVAQTVSQVDGPAPVFTQTSDPTDVPKHFPPPAEPFPVIPGYSIAEKLGKGGMGAVYLARQAGLNRLVALKMTLTGETGSTLRFLAECEAIAAIRHKNVVEVYQFGEHEGRPFLSMEYCPGGSLKDRIAKTPKFNPREVAELMAKIAAGVGAAHAAGIVHRDLKPDNIVFTADGEPKVADFGLAKLGGGSEFIDVENRRMQSEVALTRTSAQMGTPYYMPPEQVRGESKFVGPQADVWALGVIMYEVMTGIKPFAGATIPDVFEAILKGSVIEPSKLTLNPPIDVVQICKKCMSINPSERYPTAEALAADLIAYLGGVRVFARPVGYFSRKWERVKSHPIRAVVLTAVLMAGLAAGISVPRYRSAQAIAQSADRKGVWIESDPNAVAAFKVLGQEAHVYKYSGGPVDAWIELSGEGLSPVTVRLDALPWGPKNSAVGPDEQVEGSFVWVRDKADDMGVERWQVGYEHVKFTRAQIGSEVSTEYGSTQNVATKKDVKCSGGSMIQTLKVWPEARKGRSSGTWCDSSGGIQNPIPTDKPVCILELTGGASHDGVDFVEEKKKGYRIRLMCQAIDEPAQTGAGN